MTSIYRYILNTDNGMAPCIDNGILSLATCKPGIRKMASIGDWVAGFMPGSEHRGELVWAGRVERILPVGEYQRTHGSRSDAVYRETAVGFEALLRGYHCDPVQQARDTRNPVLVFSAKESWYFGSQPRSLPDALMHLAAAGQGYRVNFRQSGDLETWQSWLGREPFGIHGLPRDKLVLCAGCRFCDGGANGPGGCGAGSRRPRGTPTSC